MSIHDVGPKGNKELDPEAVEWFGDDDPFKADSEPMGEPCDKCGSLEKWWNLRQQMRCGKCLAAQLERSHELLTLASKLRGASRG